jgi:hypothetical protein
MYDRTDPASDELPSSLSPPLLASDDVVLSRGEVRRLLSLSGIDDSSKRTLRASLLILLKTPEARS